VKEGLGEVLVVLRKQQICSNVAVVMTYYILSLSSHFLLFLFQKWLFSALIFSSEEGEEQMGEEEEAGSKKMPARHGKSGRNRTKSCSHGRPCLCECNSSSGLHCFFSGHLTFI